MLIVLSLPHTRTKKSDKDERYIYIQFAIWLDYSIA